MTLSGAFCIEVYLVGLDMLAMTAILTDMIDDKMTIALINTKTIDSTNHIRF